jgi:hypothetical protein
MMKYYDMAAPENAQVLEYLKYYAVLLIKASKTLWKHSSGVPN